MLKPVLNRWDWLEISPDPVFEGLTTCIAGAGYVPQIEDRVAELTLGGPLILQREPWNPYDDRAIVVLSPQGCKLGYIPRRRNQRLARELDQGRQFSVTLTAIDGAQSGWPQLTVRIMSRNEGFLSSSQTSMA